MQKKVLGKLGNKNTIKHFIDDNIAALLDHVFQLCKDYTKSKKEAEKLMKNIIKIVIKIGILYRNNQFSEQELALAENFRKKFRTLIMTFTSFCTVDFSYDKNFLAKLINDCCSMLTQLVSRLLTEKSTNRIQSVFKFFSDDNFLDTIFEKDCPLQKHIDPIVKSLDRLIENGDIWHYYVLYHCASGSVDWLN